MPPIDSLKFGVATHNNRKRSRLLPRAVLKLRIESAFRRSISPRFIINRPQVAIKLLWWTWCRMSWLSRYRRAASSYTRYWRTIICYRAAKVIKKMQLLRRDYSHRKTDSVKTLSIFAPRTRKRSWWHHRVKFLKSYKKTPWEDLSVKDC